MRDYAKVTPKFWVGETGRAMRGEPLEVRVVAMYLLTAPHSNMIGLYYLGPPTLAHETGIPVDRALDALGRLETLGFASYDHEAEMVWVHEMARIQIGESLKPSDNRVVGIQREYDALPDCRFLGAFFDRYAEPFSMRGRRQGRNERSVVGTTEPLGRGFRGASKPLGSQEQEQEKEQDPPLSPPQVASEPSTRLAATAVVETSSPGRETAPDKGLGERRARRRWSGPATGEVARVWSAWLELVEPRAVWGDERGDLIQDWLRSGVTADRLIAAIEGYAGDPDWGRGDRRRLLTIEVALGSAAALERGWSMRGHRNWRDPRRPRAARPPARDAPAPLPPPLNGAVPPIEELGGLPDFLRAERERRARA